MTDRTNPEHPPRGNENPKDHLDELLGGFASDLDRELSAVVDETRQDIDTAREAQVTRRESEPMSGLEVRNGEEEVLYGKIKREDVEQWIRTRRDYRYKLVAVSDNLRALRRICDEISHLRGWAQLMSVINTLPSNELADEVRWKQKKLWLDDQFEILKGKADKESEPAEKLESFYLELHDLLVASQGVLLDLRQRGTSEVRDDDSETEERHRIPFHERLTMTRKLIDEWKVLVRQSEMQEKDFRAVLAQKLGKKPEQVLDVREFARELRVLGERHHWEGEAAKGDKSHVRIKMGHLEEIMPIAREIAMTSQSITSPESDNGKGKMREIGDKGTMRLEDNAFSDVSFANRVGEREIRRAERDAQRLEELQDIVNNFRESYSQFQLAEDLPTHRRSYERYGQGEKAEVGKIIIPPLDESNTVITDPREILKQGIHDIYAEFFLAATPEKLKERASGKGQEGARQFEAYKNYLKNLYNRLWAQIEAVQKGLTRGGNEKKDDGPPREQEKSKRELERLLKEKLQLFVQLMNERLLQAEPGLSYARRRGRILAQMPEFAELILQRQSSTVLSSDEREAMIERNTSSIEIPK